MPVKPINKLLPTSTELLPDARQVKVICSTDSVDRMGDIIVQDGMDLAPYRKNPVVLWGHDSDMPVAKAVEIGIEGGKLKALVEFPAEGVDADADRVYGKIKAGIVNATSVGFAPKEYEPIDPREPWGGLRFKTSELLEFSFVSVPANKECLIVGRSMFMMDAKAADGPMMDPADCPKEDCPMMGMDKDAKARVDRALALPEKLRADAKKIPATVKGARGIYLRIANLIERTLTEEGAAVDADEIVPAEEPVIDTPAPTVDPVVAAGFRDIADHRIRLLKTKLA